MILIEIPKRYKNLIKIIILGKQDMFWSLISQTQYALSAMNINKML